MNDTTRSNRFALVGLLFGLFTATSQAAMAQIRPAHRAISDRYIVVLADDVRFGARPGESSRQAYLRGTRELAGFYGGNAEKTFGAALKGFAFSGNRAAAENLSRDPRVAYVAEDGLVTLSAVQTPAPSWGLDRIDQRDQQLNSEYEYHANGSGVDLYVIDSGVHAAHHDFGGRVDTVNAFTAIQDGLGTDDCNGHGTHVAGVAGSSTYGVAKGVSIHPVRVVGCDGSGPVSNVIAGVDWITERQQAPGAHRAVANLSLNNSFSQPLDDAVSASIAAGVVYVVAAGNDGEDASCYLSPQRLPQAITVGASTQAGARWSQSNYGTCVDLFAPGENIVSTFIRNDDDAIAMSGTSVAAPHVAGTAALILSAQPDATPDEVQSMIAEEATADELQDVGPGSANLLLFSAFAGSDTAEPSLFVDGFESGDTLGWGGAVGVLADTRY